jgi:hypothetical protein
MRTGFRFAGLAMVALTALAIPASAQDKTKDKAAAAAPSADEKAAMDAMMKAASPGKQHKQLASMAGTFDAKVKMYNAPGAPAQESTGTLENKSILGGRQLEAHYEGTMMGQPFTGTGMTGYDNVTKKYVSTWADTMTTGIMMMSGVAGKTPNTIMMKGSMADPMTGKNMPIQEKLTITDADHQTLEMWGPAPDGKNFKMMEIVYTRKK